MNIRLLTRLWVIIALVVGMILAANPVLAARDRQPPTTPTNLRVTGMTAYSVSLAWNPSTDNSGSVIYKICCANVSSETFPGPASTRVYRAGLDHGLMGHGSTVVYGNVGVENTYQVIAVDSAGNQSAPATLTTCAGAIC